MLNFLRRLPLISASNYLLVHQKLVPQVPQTIASDTLVLDVVPQGPQTIASSAPDECLKCPRRVPQVPQVPQTSAPSAPNECPKRVPQVPQKSAPVPQMRNKVVSTPTPPPPPPRYLDYTKKIDKKSRKRFEKLFLERVVMLPSFGKVLIRS